MKKFNLLILLLGMFLVSCASALYKEFEQLKVGMDKSQVVEVVGSPSRTDYRMNKHIWTYRFFDNGQPFTKELHFDKDKLVYIGDPIPVKRPKYSTAADEAEIQRDTAPKASPNNDHVVSEEIRKASEDEANAPQKPKVVPEFKPVE